MAPDASTNTKTSINVAPNAAYCEANSDPDFTMPECNAIVLPWWLSLSGLSPISTVLGRADKRGNEAATSSMGLVGHQMHLLDLECLHEGLVIVVGIAASAHRTIEAISCESGHGSP